MDEFMRDYELAIKRGRGSMTPLIWAAQTNNIEITDQLLKLGYSIEPPLTARCPSDADYLRRAQFRMNTYKALASPVYMALSSADPLRSAFEMSAELERLAWEEPNYKEEYMRLRAQCQAFATKLIDLMCSKKELEIVIDFDARHHDYVATQRQASEVDGVEVEQRAPKSQLKLLKEAIRCKQKTFCAHPHIQELLETKWYENLPGFRRKNIFQQTLQVLSIGLMFPIYSLAYLIAPHSSFGSNIKKPFVKFICHSASYISFLITLTLASQRIEAFYEWSSVLSLFVSERSSPFQSVHQINKHVGAFTASTDALGANNLTLLKVAINNTPTGSYRDDPELNTLAALYKHSRGSAGVAAGPRTLSSSRGLESLSTIFEVLPASSKKRGTLPSPIESVILVWVLSHIWAEAKQIRKLGTNYYHDDMWNVIDSIANGCYIGTIGLRIVSYVQSDDKSLEVAREHWHNYDPILISECLFAFATIFSVLKLIYVFSVNPYLGPLQISLSRMIIDIIRFSWIYILVLFAFACGMNQLLWYYADLERHHCLNVTNYNLAQYYASEVIGANNNSHASETSIPPVAIDDSCKTWRHFSNVFESTQALFWANFGLVDLENFDLTGIKPSTRFWALLMFGCYCFINVIVVLNLLIAMMNNSYVKISKRSDIEWKFARTRLWVSYFESGSTVPAPFNIVPSLKSIKNLFRRGSSNNVEAMALSEYHAVMRTLVNRYLYNLQLK